jgi:rod shape-determining protein MreC
MPVVNKDGVIGKITQALHNISLVQLIRDPSERISVMIKKSHAVGILETLDSKNFFIQYRKHAEVKEGDTIVTSGLGGIYPKGLTVGTVTGIHDSDDPLFKDVVMKPCVDFDHLEEVFVMQLDPQWAAFRSELDSIDIE